jgi:5'-3' exonuclease
MGTVLIVDFNNLLFRTLFTKDVGIRTEMPSWALWRYLVFDSIYEQLGHLRPWECVLAVDDKNSWRKTYWNRYKESRKAKRERQKIPCGWDHIFNEINSYLKDLKHHMPFRVMKVRGAEADDIIAVLAKDLTHSDEELTVVVSSNDEDYLQLVAPRIKIWNPSKKEYVKHEKSPARFLLEKILMGQPKDDIFNVKTPSDWPIGKRKPGLGKVTAEKLIGDNLKRWLIENNYEENFKRNRVLIDFNYIPQTIQSRIIQTYDRYSFPPPRNIMPFFKKHSMRSYQENYHEAEQRLMDLY